MDEKSDIYSFGVVLLELITGRYPIDPEFDDGTDIVKWVSAKVVAKEGLHTILDPCIIDGKDLSHNFVHLLKVALFCTQTLPRKRPSMRKVVTMLLEIDPPNRPTAVTKLLLQKNQPF